MKQNRLITAHNALGRVCKERFPLPVALKLAELKRETQKAYDFQLEEETKIFTAYKPEIDGTEARFRTPEDCLHFDEEMRKLKELDVPFELPAVIVPTGCGASISPEDVEALDGFVTFVEA